MLFLTFFSSGQILSPTVSFSSFVPSGNDKNDVGDPDAAVVPAVDHQHPVQDRRDHEAGLGRNDDQARRRGEGEEVLVRVEAPAGHDQHADERPGMPTL